MADQAERTPEGAGNTSMTPTVRTPLERARVLPYPGRVRTPVRNTVYESVSSGRCRLEAQPIVKTTVGQRDTPGDTLDDFVARGSSFQAMVRKLWDHFSPRVKRRAVRTDGVLSIQLPSLEHWTKLMQYKYGIAISKAQDRDTFKDACIRPLSTGRAEATAEVSLREVVECLHEWWDDSFDGEAVIWRINARVEEHLGRMRRSVHTALDCVDSALANYTVRWQDLATLGLRLDSHETGPLARKAAIEATIRDIELPDRVDVANPMEQMENISDFEHA
ncbi:hypothetical protein ON010_g18089 [Phytophthora cinnamomi]|nr:hypothetical protein ON010_g18089 [Phytophthora cinnamomi]